MENKQTAVEWLVKMLYSPVCVGFIQGRRQIPHDIIEQAKQIEKEQMIEFANSFYDDCVMEGGSLQQSAEEHYNETYGEQKNGNKCFECNIDKGNNELYCSFCRNQN